MKDRILRLPSGGEVTIEASQTRCLGCQFEHDNADACTLFDEHIAPTEPVKGMDHEWEYTHRRLKACVIAEWRAKKAKK